MPDHLGDDMRKTKDKKEEPEKDIKGIVSINVIINLHLDFFTALDEGDIALLKTYVSITKTIIRCLIPFVVRAKDNILKP